jgi:RNA-binding protein
MKEDNGRYMVELSGKQKRTLKSLAHHLKPVVYIGKNGITPGLMQAIEQALDDHELIKIKFIDFKDEKRDFLERIAAETGAQPLNLIGNIAIVFRQCSDESKRKIAL